MAGQYTPPRRFERIAVDRPAYAATPIEGPKHRTLTVHEIGEGGCLLLGNDFMGVGRVLTLDIILDATRPVRAIAKILYEYQENNDEIFSGAEFQFVHDEHADMLRDFIDTRIVRTRQLMEA